VFVGCWGDYLSPSDHTGAKDPAISVTLQTY
jgi:hypothetical protein